MYSNCWLSNEFTVVVDYTIRDQDDGLTDTSTITITVKCNREEIEAIDDMISTGEDSEETINVLTNDNDPEGNPEETLDVTSITQPDIGTLTNNEDGTVTYTPGQEGNDKCDEIAGQCRFIYYSSNLYCIEIKMMQCLILQLLEYLLTCNRATPQTQPDEVETDENTPTDPFDPTDNDRDPEGEPLELVDVDQPEIGTITKTGNNVGIYPR